MGILIKLLPTGWRRTLGALLVSAIYSTGSLADSQIMVVANVGAAPPALEKSEIRNLFMGGVSQLALHPVALTPGTRERLIFNTRIVGLTESRVQSYWAQMRFSGREKPPVEVDSVNAMIRYLLNNEGRVGYVPANTPLPAELTVLYKAG